MRGLRRTVGLLGTGVRRVWYRGWRSQRGRVLLGIAGVAITIAVLVMVTGLAVGLAMEATVFGENVQYAITPEGPAEGSAIASPDNPQFGQAHTGMETMLAHEAVTGATPVLLQLESLDRDGDHAGYMLVIGIVPESAPDSVAGIPTTRFSPGAPYHAEGTWTGEATISAAGAELLDLDVGDDIVIGESPESFVIE